MPFGYILLPMMFDESDMQYLICFQKFFILKGFNYHSEYGIIRHDREKRFAASSQLERTDEACDVV